MKWASFNLGATASWEQGELYLWGDTNNTGAVPTYEAPNMDNICGSKYDIERSMWAERGDCPVKVNKWNC